MTEALPWIAVAVELGAQADPVALDVATGELFELGAEGLEQRDGPPVTLLASFASDHPEALMGDVQAALSALGLPVTQVSLVRWPDVDWATIWHRHFKALSFGRVWVVPSWLEAPAEAEVVLRVDPGMAFGTGLHPTTALCMRRVVELSPMDRMLDVGTGTGILALAAAALGATVLATDIDADAVKIAGQNAADNGLSDRITFVATGDPSGEETFGLVVANILAEPLMAMADAVAARVAPGGRLLLSGLLAPQADAVFAAYAAAGVSVEVDRVVQDNWALLDLRKPA